MPPWPPNAAAPVTLLCLCLACSYLRCLAPQFDPAARPSAHQMLQHVSHCFDFFLHALACDASCTSLTLQHAPPPTKCCSTCQVALSRSHTMLLPALPRAVGPCSTALRPPNAAASVAASAPGQAQQHLPDAHHALQPHQFGGREQAEQAGTQHCKWTYARGKGEQTRGSGCAQG
eukprot:1161779-Pelagomonas_calceolata.AAC.7